MLSPKFPLKTKDLKLAISSSRLKLAWKTRVRDAMRTQVLSDPIEYLDFHITLEASCAAIEAEIFSGSYVPRPPIRMLAEKSKGLCRQIVIPTVKDALILQTLSDALWFELKTKAPSKNSFFAPGDHKFSNTIKGHTSDYGPVNPWLQFQKAIFGFSASKKFIIVTDIANYYDHISYEHLRNIIAGLTLAREQLLDILIYTLSSMLWQPDYMPRVPVGLPQCNLDAPRLLAHCFLFEIDSVLTEMKHVEFARYMDDIDIGVDSVSEAKLVIRDLDLALQTRQVRLNSGKTRILSDSDAQKHFRIKENALLDKLSDRIDSKRKAQTSLHAERFAIQYAISAGLSTGAYSDGNGEKVLKRLLTLSRQIGVALGDTVLEAILLRWPSLVGSVLLFWQSSASAGAQLHIISNFVASGRIIDDAMLVQVATAVVAARLQKTQAVSAEIAKIQGALDVQRPWSFWSRLWIASKYEDSAAVMKLVEDATSVWSTQEHLGRLVGGVTPRIAGTKHYAKFEALISRIGSLSAKAVMEFHQDLAQGIKGFTAVRKFLVAPNPSLPNGLSHAKFLMLASALQNGALATSAVAKLKSAHTFALSDPYYVSLI